MHLPKLQRAETTISCLLKVQFFNLSNVPSSLKNSRAEAVNVGLLTCDWMILQVKAMVETASILPYTLR